MTALDAPSGVAAATGTRRSTWALWGTGAGLCGLVTNMFAAQTVSEEISRDGVAALSELSRGAYHVSAIAGYAAVLCLLVFAAGFSRWGQRQASDSLSLRLIPLGLIASAAALIVSYGVKGQFSAYLEGGFNADGGLPQELLFSLYAVDDLWGYFSWFGVAVAAGAIAVLAFRERLVARWIGALGALVVVAVLGFLVPFGFTGFSGVIAPVFLIPAGIGLAFGRE